MLYDNCTSADSNLLQGIQTSSAKLLLGCLKSTSHKKDYVTSRGDHGPGVPEGVPVGVYDFCWRQSRTRSRSFELKPEPEQE